jgi:hypothetical protein
MRRSAILHDGVPRPAHGRPRGAAPTWCSQRRHAPQPCEPPPTSPAEFKDGQNMRANIWFGALQSAVSPLPLTPSPSRREGEPAASRSGPPRSEHGCCPHLNPAEGERGGAEARRRGGDEPDAGVPCSPALPTGLFSFAPMQPSQRRHPPQPYEPPTTSLPPLAGDQGGLRRGRLDRLGARWGTVRVPPRGA